MVAHETNGADTAKVPNNNSNLKNAHEVLTVQKHRDALREQEQMRRWIDEDEPRPVKMSCKLSQHIVAKKDE